ncbi:MAG: thiazole synthase [Candidatus Omnitrophota bacterium]|jgi:thiazole synthase
MIGSARYPSPEALQASVTASGAGIITVSLRRESAEGGGQAFWETIRNLDCAVLPNTAGCKSVKEAVTTAHMAREVFDTHWIKLELIGDEYTLQPDPIALVEAARILAADGFEVFPYATEDLIIAQRLVEAGCRIVMPWAAPIGSAQGILNPYLLQTLRARLPEIQLVVDAGIGTPSDAVKAMELGYDGVLVNSAIALADDPIAMGMAFGKAVEAGRLGYKAGLMGKRETASPSTPTLGTPFWHQEEEKHA